MPFYIISQPPSDDFTFRLLYNTLINYDLPFEIDCFYAHSYHIEEYYNENIIFPPPNLAFPESEIKLSYQYINTGLLNREFLENNIKNKVVLLVLKDHLSGDRKNINDSFPLIEYIRDLVNKHSDKKFILSTSLENLKNYFTGINNVIIIHHGGDIVNQYYAYKKLKPVLNKNFDSETTSISLNRNFRYQRLILLGLLMQYNVVENFQLSCMFKDFINSIDLEKNFKYFMYKDELFLGIDKLKNYDFDIQHQYDIYPVNANDNAKNFSERLYPLYKDSFIEIVTETTYIEECFLITEKTANAFLACNFPIILNGRNSIDFLRKIGFDMFDDIIDHSYDTIIDPIERIRAAIKNNKEILTDSDLIKSLWEKNKHRFINNVYTLKNKLYLFYKDRFEKELRDALNEI
jgi:hypothetical protein